MDFYGDKMKKILCLISIFLMLMLISCSKKTVKQVNVESALMRDAVRTVETITNAYLKQDHAAIQVNSTKEASSELLKTIRPFEKAELTLSPRWVEIEDSVIYLNVAWFGTWVANGKKTEERGMAVFVLEGQPLKLKGILRANPFRYPE